jgi:hypothetical protein
MDKATAKEIHDESLAAQASARAATRKRKNWGVVRVSVVEDWAKKQPTVPTIVDETTARQFFGVRLDAPVRRGANPELFGVWLKLEEPLDGDEPEFILDPEPDGPIDPAVLESLKVLNTQGTRLG